MCNAPPWASPPYVSATSGWLHISGKDILDANNNIIHLRGVTKWSTCTNNPWANWEKVTEDDIQHMLKVFPAMNFIYVLLQAKMLYPNWESGDFNTVNQQYLSMIDNWVSWCKKYNVRCVLQVHYINGEAMFNTPDIYPDLWTNNGKYRDLLVRFWTFLANRYKDNDAMVGIDILNEVGWTNAQQFKDMMTTIANAILNVNPNLLILIQWHSWYSGVMENWIKTLGPIDLPNIVYVSHYYWRNFDNGNWYDAMRFSHYNLYAAGDYANGAEQMEAELANSILLKDLSVPCMVNEFGLSTASGDDTPFLQYMQDFIALLDRTVSGWNCFNWGGRWQDYSLAMIRTNSGTADKWEPPYASYRPVVDVLQKFIGQNSATSTSVTTHTVVNQTSQTSYTTVLVTITSTTYTTQTLTVTQTAVVTETHTTTASVTESSTTSQALHPTKLYLSVPSTARAGRLITITGRLVDAETEIGISGRPISLSTSWGWSETIFTGPDGMFSVVAQCPKSGKYSVTASFLFEAGEAVSIYEPSSATSYILVYGGYSQRTILRDFLLPFLQS